ncbi:MAG: phospholipase D-like domain-containing protein [Sulfurifustis sp.]
MKRRGALILVAGLLVVWLAGRAVVTYIHPHTPASAPVLTATGPYRPGMSLHESFASLPASAEATRLTLLLNNPQSWAERWRLLASARETLDISYFILREDLFGAAFLGHLIKKAEEGVQVRLLLDAQGTVMSFTSPRGNDWLDTLANTGNVRVKIFRPLWNRYVEAFFTINPVALVASEHDKILVVDRRVGMIGGRNISAEYFADPADLPKAFEDTDVVLRGQLAARRLLEAFELQFGREDSRPLERAELDLAGYTEELLLAYRAMDAWLKGVPLDAATQARIKELNLPWRKDLAKYPRLRGVLAAPAPEPDAKAETRLLDSRTRLEMQNDVIGQALARLAQTSRRYILIQSPYLVLSKEAVDLLAEVGARGVSIDILTNSPLSSDNAWSQAFFLEQWPELLARVPNLRIFVAGHTRTLHTKLAIFDEQVTLVGTYNLDPISMEINSEIMAAVWSKSFADAAARHPRALLGGGPPLVYEYRIERDARGNAVRGDDGKPVIAFGPRDHADPSEWRKVQLYWATLRAAEKVGGFAPFF